MLSKVNLSMIQAAREIIAPIIRRTPMIHSQTFSDWVGFPVYLKLENLQKTGSFKIRGAYNRLHNLSDADKVRGVFAVSAGNHAQGVALAARLVGAKARIFMPETAPLSKVKATTAYGAEIVMQGIGFDEAAQAAKEWQETHDALFISPFDDDAIIAGQGTIALEMLEDLPNLKTVVVPIGGGGLISGIAIALKTLKPDVRVIGVQVDACQPVARSFKTGHLTILPVRGTIADGIAVKRPSQRTFELIERYVDEVHVVSDDAIASAIFTMAERKKLVLEGSGAASLAALLSGMVQSTGPTVVLLSGGNLDPIKLASIIDRGMLACGRYIELTTTIEDHPGSLRRLLDLVSEMRANVINIFHDRMIPELPLGKVMVRLNLETNDQEHIDRIKSAMTEAGYVLHAY